jgi:hypothetical protein
MVFSQKEIIIYKSTILEYIKDIDTFIIFFLLIVLLLAISFTMSIFTQVFFDNTMKKNFNGYLFYKHENALLDTLRAKSIIKLNKESDIFNEIELTDYFLYQVIGRKLQFLEQLTKTTRYIDEIKSSGSIFIAFIFASGIQIKIDFSKSSLFIGLLLIVSIYFLAKDYIKSKYRSRAIRIYTNYLIGENNCSTKIS